MRYNLAIDTGSGNATLGGIGTTDNLGEFSVVSTGMVELNGAVEADQGIDLSGASNVDLLTGSGFFTTINSDILLNGGAVDGDVLLSLTAGSGNVRLGNVGKDFPVSTLLVNTAGSTFLEGNLNSVGAIALNDDGIELVTDVDMTAGTSISLNDLSGNNRSLDIDSGTFTALDTVSGVDSLDVNSGGTIFVAEAVSANSGVSMVTTADAAILVADDADITSQGGTIELSAQGDLTVGAGAEITNDNGPVTLQANSDDADGEDHDLTIRALINGSPVTLEAMGSLADIILDTVAQDVGDTIIFNGNTTLNVDVTALNDMIFNGDVTLATAAHTLTATDGGIDLNGAVDGAFDLNLDALNGTISAQGIGTTIRVGDLAARADNLELNGNIIAGAVTTTGVTLTTLLNDVTIDGTGAIDLGDANGPHLLDIDAGSSVLLDGLDIGSLTVDGGTTVTFNGNVETTGSVGVGDGTAPSGAVTINAVVEAGGPVSLSGGVIEVNANVSGESVNVNSISRLGSGSGQVTISGNDGVGFGAAVTLEDGPVAVSSANGSVSFSDTINGSQNLSVNADDTVTLGGIVGGTTGLGAFDVSAGVLIDVNAAVADAASILFNGMTDLGGDLTATGTSITLNGEVLLSEGARTLTAVTEVDANDDISGPEALTIEAATVYLSSVGEGENPTLLDVNATQLWLEGDVTVDGSVRLDGAATTTLSNEVTIDTTGGADGSIVDFAELNGPRSLKIAGGDADVDFNGAVTELTELTVTSSDTTTVDAPIDIPGPVDITASELIDVNAGIGTSEAPDLITLTGATNLGGDLIAVNDITLNDPVTLSGGDRTVWSNDGSIDLNAAVNGTTEGAEGLSLNAPNGTIFAEEIGTTVHVGALVMSSLAAELAGDLMAASVDTTGVGLTTLTADIVDVDTTWGGSVALGDLIGNNLTISAGTTVSLSDALITSLTIDDATGVTLDGNVVTTGETTINTAIDGDVVVTGSGSISGGGGLTIETTGGGGDVIISGPVTTPEGVDIEITSVDNVTVNADVSASEGSVSITANGSNVTVNDPANLTGTEVTVTSAGTGGDIDLNTQILNNLSGNYAFVADDAIRLGGGNQSITALEDVTFAAGSVELMGADGSSYLLESTGDSVHITAELTDANGNQSLSIVGAKDVWIAQTTLDNAGSNLRAEAGADVRFEDNVHVVNGNLWADAGEDVELVGGTVTSMTGSVLLTADSHVQIGADVEAGQNIEAEAADSIETGGTLRANHGVSLMAEKNIEIGADVTADWDSNGIGQAVITADSDGSSSGDLTVTSGTISGEHVALGGHNISAQSLTADRNGDGAGNISVIASNEVLLGGAVTAGGSSGNVHVEAERDLILADPITAGADTGTFRAVIDGSIDSAGQSALVTAATIDINAAGQVGNNDGRLWADASTVYVDTTEDGGGVSLQIIDNNGDIDQAVVASTVGNNAPIDIILAGITDPDGITVDTLTTGESSHTSIASTGGSELNLANIVTYNGNIRVSNDASINANRVLAQDVSGGSDGVPNTPDDLNGNRNASRTIVLTTTNGGNVNIAAGGLMADADVTINASGGVFDGANSEATNIFAGNDINLNSGWRVGEDTDPLEIDAGNGLLLSYTGSGPTSTFFAIINGVINGSTDPTLLEYVGPPREPPGLILYNGVAVGGPFEDLMEYPQS